MAETTGTTAAGRVGAGSSRDASESWDAEPQEVLLDYYRQMVLIRSFELTSSEMYRRAKIGGYCHLNLGEEATVVGLMAALERRDYLFTNYRDHGYALSKGMEPGAVMAELFGKTTGVAKGRGGSMHMFDTETRMLGGYGVVGGQLPPATGAALALTYRGGPGPEAEAVMCQMGDGTTNIGAFHESLNLAAIWDLPIVFVIVNNRLGMGTTVEAASAEPELYKRGASYRIPGERVDGNDVLAVRDAAAAAMHRARTEHKPFLLELMSYRLKGHSVVDPARYRSAAETNEAKEFDPLPATRTRLLQSGVIDEEALMKMEADADDQVAAAVDFADSSPDPSPEELFDYAYATDVANAPHTLPGEPVMEMP